MAAERLPYMTVAQYLDLDRMAGVKHEYVDGVAYAMAGGTKTHNRLARRAANLIEDRLRKPACLVYGLDMRVEVDENRFLYPDAVVSCDPADAGPGDILLYPRVILEVLSDSTESYDRQGKFEMYRSRETLREYVLVSQRDRRVDVFTRTGEAWEARAYGPDGEVELRSLDVRFAVTDLYSGIPLEDL